MMVEDGALFFAALCASLYFWKPGDKNVRRRARQRVNGDAQNVTCQIGRAGWALGDNCTEARTKSAE